ncbi:MAG: hypothetical protein HZA19_04500, partial [Nitrospirae bacterium]|nr:hypothetical protein [Nitrospirota bacterium]
EAERVFGENPSLEEAARHLDRELSRKYAPQFDLIRQASGEIQRRIEAGEVDHQAGEAAKGQMALQVAQTFKAEKAEALRAYEEGLGYAARHDWEAARQAFSRTFEIAPNPAAHLALANTITHMGIGHSVSAEALRHYDAAAATYRDASEKQGLAIALSRTVLLHFNTGNREKAIPMLQEALGLFKDLRDRKRGGLVGEMMRVL